MLRFDSTQYTAVFKVRQHGLSGGTKQDALSNNRVVTLAPRKTWCPGFTWKLISTKPTVQHEPRCPEWEGLPRFQFPDAKEETQG